LRTNTAGPLHVAIAVKVHDRREEDAIPSKYQTISALAAGEVQSVASDTDRYIAFLNTAAYNYKYRFLDQLLIHAQKPGATACAEIAVWNRLGRWVNKGTKGIALLNDREQPYRLRYVFDISDTNSRMGSEISIWQMKSHYEAAVIEALENGFGKIKNKNDILTALMEVTSNQVAENLNDFLDDLSRVKEDSLLENLDIRILEKRLKSLLQNSVGYILTVRCGFEPSLYFSNEDFVHVTDFDTIETFSILGAATAYLSEPILREIEETIRWQIRAEKAENRSVEANDLSLYHDEEIEIIQRSSDDGNDVFDARGLSDPEPDAAANTEDWQIRQASTQLSSEQQERTVHGHASDEQTERTSGEDRSSGDGDGEVSHFADDDRTERDTAAAQGESRTLDTEDGAYPSLSGNDRYAETDLQLSGRNGNFTWEVSYFHHDNEKNELLRTCDVLRDHRIEIAAFFADHQDRKERGEFVRSFFNNTFIEHILSDGQRVGYRAYADMLHLWRGSYLSRTHEVYQSWETTAGYIEGMIILHRWLDTEEIKLLSVEEQIALIDRSETEKSKALYLPQEAIDYVLTRGSGVSQGKLRIYEFFSQGKPANENIEFLKREYGMGGTSDAIPGSGLWEMHDGRGITIYEGGINREKSCLLRWTAVEKRIRELIKDDWYLNPREKHAYPAYQRERALREARTKIAEEYRVLLTEYNEYLQKVNRDTEKLNIYVLGDCASQFAQGKKTTYTLTKDNFILPLMRSVMQTIIGENTHLTARCEAVLQMLDSDLAKPMEPTYEELQPVPPPRREYRFSVGDKVYLGTQEYEVLEVAQDSVQLLDPQFPLLNKVMTKAEFEAQIAENPRNLHLVATVAPKVMQQRVAH